MNRSKFGCRSRTQATCEDEIAYCQRLITFIEMESGVAQVPKITEPLNLLKETVEDDVEQLRLATDPDARVGHKSVDSAFFGYKTHLAMTEERIITAAVITTGEKNNGKQLQALVEKSQVAGMEVKSVIGDAAYSEKDNLTYAKHNKIELVAKLNPLITQGTRKKEDEFLFNKDAGMYVCKAGQLAIPRLGKARKALARTRQTLTFST